MTDFHDMIASLQVRERDPSDLDPATARELLIVEEHTLLPGQIVRQKRGVKAFGPFRGGLALYLHDGKGGFEAGIGDCMLLTIDDDGALREQVFVKRYLEPAPEGE